MLRGAVAVLAGGLYILVFVAAHVYGTCAVNCVIVIARIINEPFQVAVQLLGGIGVVYGKQVAGSSVVPVVHILAGLQGIAVIASVAQHQFCCLREFHKQVGPAVAVGLSRYGACFIGLGRLLASFYHVALGVKGVLAAVYGLGQVCHHVAEFIHIFPSSVFFNPCFVHDLAVAVQTVCKAVLVQGPFIGAEGTVPVEILPPACLRIAPAASCVWLHLA